MTSLTSSILKTLIYLFNVIIFLCGAVVFGLGIWSAVDNTQIFTLLNNVMLAGVWVLIIGGAIIMIISFLGCFGAHNDSKPAIVVFCTIALIAIALKIIGCILLLNYYLQSADYLASTYETEYNGDADSRATRIWDETQKLGECCGWYGYLEWTDSDFYNVTKEFPESCCVLEREDNLEILDWKPLNEENCQKELSGFIHDRGCVHVLRSYYYAISITTVVFIALELVSVVLIVYFYQRIP